MMNLDEAIEALNQAKEAIAHGGKNDILSFVPSLISALEYTIAELQMLNSMPLDEFCLWKEDIKKEN